MKTCAEAIAQLDIIKTDCFQRRFKWWKTQSIVLNTKATISKKIKNHSFSFPSKYHFQQKPGIYIYIYIYMCVCVYVCVCVCVYV